MVEHRAAPGPWFTVAVTCAVDASELVADVLWQAGTPAVEERAIQSRLVVLLAGYPDEAVARRTAAAVVGIGADGVQSVEVTPVIDDGLDGWREHATVIPAGPFTLVPTWVDHHPDPGERVLHVDPGPTFGSGSHPTTRLVITAMHELTRPGRRVLDVGCGSGVLAIAAALNGADAVGIDIDPAAKAVTTENARRNRVADRVRFDHRPLAVLAREAREHDHRFDVVVANLLSPIVVDLATDLAEVVAPQGHLVVSGLLADRIQPALDALEAVAPDLALTLVGNDEADGWTALTFERRST